MLLEVLGEGLSGQTQLTLMVLQEA